MDYNIKNNLKFNVEIKDNVVFKSIADYNENKNVSKCLVYTNEDHTNWTISSWFTVPEFSNMGIGFYTMQAALKSIFDKFGHPDTVDYIWNGANSYVLDWLEENFDATCKCPMVVQKTQSGDDWESHIYSLNTKKVLSYFELDKDIEISADIPLR